MTPNAVLSQLSRLDRRVTFFGKAVYCCGVISLAFFVLNWIDVAYLWSIRPSDSYGGYGIWQDTAIWRRFEFNQRAQLSQNFSLYLSIFGAVVTGGLAFAWRSLVKRHTDLIKAVSSTFGSGSYPLMVKNKDFALFLRPFFITGNVEIPRSALWGFFSSLTNEFFSSIDAKLRDLEVVVSRANLPRLITLSVGGDEVEFGPGRVRLTNIDEWRQSVSALAEGARIIFVVPFDQPGTRWEIEHLVNTKRIQKAVFIMPSKGSATRIAPDTSEDPDLVDSTLLEALGVAGLQLAALAHEEGMRLAQYQHVQFCDYWQHSRHVFASLGLDLPEFRDEGMVFTVNTEGISAQFPLSINGLKSAAETMYTSTNDCAFDTPYPER